MMRGWGSGGVREGGLKGKGREGIKREGKGREGKGWKSLCYWVRAKYGGRWDSGEGVKGGKAGKESRAEVW